MTRAKVSRCRGWAAYDGPCGALDCESCRPGSAQAWVDHYNGECGGWPDCDGCPKPEMCAECDDHRAEVRAPSGAGWCLVCAEDCSGRDDWNTWPEIKGSADAR